MSNWLSEFMNKDEVKHIFDTHLLMGQYTMLVMNDFKYMSEVHKAQPEDPLPWKFEYADNFPYRLCTLSARRYSEALTALNIMLNNYLHRSKDNG